MKNKIVKMNRYKIITFFFLVFSAGLVTAAIGGGGHGFERDDQSLTRVAKFSRSSDGSSQATCVQDAARPYEIPEDLIDEGMGLFSFAYDDHVEYEENFIKRLHEEGCIPNPPPAGFNFGSGDNVGNSDDDDDDDDEYAPPISLPNREFVLSIDWHALVDTLRKKSDAKAFGILSQKLFKAGRIDQKSELAVTEFVKRQGWGFICGCSEGNKNPQCPFVGSHVVEGVCPHQKFGLRYALNNTMEFLRLNN